MVKASQRLDTIPITSQLFLAQLRLRLLQIPQQTGSVFGQGTSEWHRIAHRSTKDMRFDVQMLDERYHLIESLMLRRLHESAILDFLVKLTLREKREREEADAHRMELVEDLGRTEGISLATTMPRQSHEIEEMVMDASFFELLALLQDIFGGISLVHPRQGLAIPTLHTDGEVIEAQVMKLAKFFYRLVADVGDARETTDGRMPLAHILSYLQGDVHQTIDGQDKGIGTCEEETMRTRLKLMNNSQVLRDFLHLRHTKLLLAIERAKLASMPSAACSNLQELGCGFVRWSPYRTIKM